MKTPATKKNTQSGFTLVEILVACTIVTLTTFALLAAASKGVEVSNQALRQTQASFLAEEGAEAVKIIRDTNWSSISGLTTNTTYYLSFNIGSNTWSLTTVPPSLIDGVFTRTVVSNAVNRDSNDNIATTGTPDNRTRQITVTVSWTSAEGATLQRNISFYISDIFN